MSETFAQYLEKWLKHSTAQGLNKPLVKRRVTRLYLLQPNATVLFITLLITSTWLTSCSIPITYHDATTYKNLTDLKAEITMLVETFDTKPFAANEAAIADISLKFRKAYEYEKGKGIANNDTLKQFDEIWKLLNDDISDYRENGNAALGPKYFREAAVVLGQAFDIAIATRT